MIEDSVASVFALFAHSPDPELAMRNLPSFAATVGDDYLLDAVAVMYLVPLLLIGVVTAVVCAVRQKRLIVRWADLGLLAVPVAVWFALSFVYPVGRPTNVLFELPVLGAVAGLTLALRSRYVTQLQGAFARTGLLGVTSLAICFWAFVPVELYL